MRRLGAPALIAFVVQAVGCFSYHAVKPTQLVDLSDSASESVRVETTSGTWQFEGPIHAVIEGSVIEIESSSYTPWSADLRYVRGASVRRHDADSVVFAVCAVLGALIVVGLLTPSYSTPSPQ